MMIYELITHSDLDAYFLTTHKKYLPIILELNLHNSLTQLSAAKKNQEREN